MNRSGAWTLTEDKKCYRGVMDMLKLRNKVHDYHKTLVLPKPFSWKYVAKIVGRSPKQCRERWFNYLAPGIISSPWTAEEDALLRRLYSRMPSQWAKISKFIPGRPQVQVKQRWNRLTKWKYTSSVDDVYTTLSDYQSLVKDAVECPMNEDIFKQQIANMQLFDMDPFHVVCSQVCMHGRI